MNRKNVLEYKGYHAKIEFDIETYVLKGKIEGINDFVNFETDNLKLIEHEFQLAVDDYLEFCQEVGKEPDKEYKGTFNIRIKPELHKKIALLASKNDESLNTTVEKAIQEYVENNVVTKSELQQTIKVLSDALITQSTYNSEQETRLYAESKVMSYDNYQVPKINMSYQEKRLS
jgi:predicted HicB family RNase H-like nuclease